MPSTRLAPGTSPSPNDAALLFADERPVGLQDEVVQHQRPLDPVRVLRPPDIHRHPQIALPAAVEVHLGIAAERLAPGGAPFDGHLQAPQRLELRIRHPSQNVDGSGDCRLRLFDQHLIPRIPCPAPTEHRSKVSRRCRLGNSLAMASLTLSDVQTLLDAPSAAVLTTIRKDGSPLTSPVWYQWTGDAFEIVIARDDVKLRHLEREPRCTLVIFEAVPPFRGVSVMAFATATRTDITEHRRAVARRYLGTQRGDRFVEQRAGKLGDLVTLVPAEQRVWDLTAILPDA